MTSYRRACVCVTVYTERAHTHTHKLEHACTPQDPCASYPHPPRFVWFLYRWLFSTNHPHPTFLPTLFPSATLHLLFLHPPPSFPFLFFSFRDVCRRRPTNFVLFFFFLFQFQDSSRIVRQLLRIYDILFILELFYLSVELKTGK